MKEFISEMGFGLVTVFVLWLPVIILIISTYFLLHDMIAGVQCGVPEPAYAQNSVLQR